MPVVGARFFLRRQNTTTLLERINAAILANRPQLFRINMRYLFWLRQKRIQACGQRAAAPVRTGQISECIRARKWQMDALNIF